MNDLPVVFKLKIFDLLNSKDKDNALAVCCDWNTFILQIEENRQQLLLSKSENSTTESDLGIQQSLFTHSRKVQICGGSLKPIKEDKLFSYTERLINYYTNQAMERLEKLEDCPEAKEQYMERVLEEIKSLSL